MADISRTVTMPLRLTATSPGVFSQRSNRPRDDDCGATLLITTSASCRTGSRRAYSSSSSDAPSECRPDAIVGRLPDGGGT
jgi:hypothetical protein